MSVKWTSFDIEDIKLCFNGFPSFPYGIKTIIEYKFIEVKLKGNINGKNTIRRNK